MAKSLERIEARKLRTQALSYKEISKRIKVSKSTVSLWCRDICLTAEQIKDLASRSNLKSMKGRLMGASMQRERRLSLIEKYKLAGKKRYAHLSEEEFFSIGVALYWAEGYRKGNKITFSNSDPLMMKLMVNWFCKFFLISVEEFRFRVDINQIHYDRDLVVKQYWSQTLGIPLNQFNKTSFKKVINKKVYENFNEHYGTLRFEISKPVRVLYPLLGYISGLALSHYRSLPA